MKKFIWVLVILVICLWGTCSVFNNKVDKEAKIESDKAALLQKEQIKQSVSQMVSMHGAITSWENHLYDRDSTIKGKFLTVDLERLWITENPILFIGRLEDISTCDSEHYIIRMEQPIFHLLTIMGNCLNLELRADKKMMDDFLSNNSKNFGEAFSFLGGENIAVVARIGSIKCSQRIQSDENGFSTEDIKTGVGECLDILYVGASYDVTP
jgi:hypothetical protein